LLPQKVIIICFEGYVYDKFYFILFKSTPAFPQNEVLRCCPAGPDLLRLGQVRPLQRQRKRLRDPGPQETVEYSEGECPVQEDGPQEADCCLLRQNPRDLEAGVRAELC
jgi:hypothetical protein